MHGYDLRLDIGDDVVVPPRAVLHGVPVARRPVGDDPARRALRSARRGHHRRSESPRCRGRRGAGPARRPVGGKEGARHLGATGARSLQNSLDDGSPGNGNDDSRRSPPAWCAEEGRGRGQTALIRVSETAGGLAHPSAMEACSSIVQVIDTKMKLTAMRVGGCQEKCIRVGKSARVLAVLPVRPALNCTLGISQIVCYLATSFLNHLPFSSPVASSPFS